MGSVRRTPRGARSPARRTAARRASPGGHGFDLDAALGRVRGRKRALILMHDNPDPDALAGAEGLRVLLGRELGIRATLGFGGIIGRAENRAMVEVLKIPLERFEMLDLRRFDLVALVDTQPNSGNNSLPRGTAADIIVDHHPLLEPHDGALWCDVRAALGASSTIIYGYLRERGVLIDVRLATAFLYALKTETRDLGREATAAEREAYIELVATADHAALDRIANPKLPREHFVALDRAIRRARVHGELLAINLGALSYPDLVAEVADLMLPFERIRWVLCVGHHGGAAYLSIRSEVEEEHAGELLRRVVGARGAAGGHGLIAGGRLYARVPDDAALEPLYADLVRDFCREIGAPDRGSTPLVAWDEPSTS